MNLEEADVILQRCRDKLNDMASLFGAYAGGGAEGWEFGSRV